MAGVNATGLRELYDHHAWATGVVLARAAELPSARTDGPARDALAHILTAERFWLAHWRGEERPDWRDLRRLPAAASAERWPLLQALTRAFLADLDDAALERILSLRTPIGQREGIPLWQMVTHVIQHGAQHRAEAAALLTAAGHSPGELDYIDFLEAREAAMGSPR